MTLTVKLTANFYWFWLSKPFPYLLCLQKVSKTQLVNPCSQLQTSRKPSISDHCRLYFGAIQKAISVLTSSLNDGQPPEKFISHSKLVIMVGQRLVNTLCNEAKSCEANREMLSMSNQVCAHLKQLALVTKKAALNFPDKLAVQEAQDNAKELAQRVQHFRMSLDVWAAVLPSVSPVYHVEEGWRQHGICGISQFLWCVCESKPATLKPNPTIFFFLGYHVSLDEEAVLKVTKGPLIITTSFNYTEYVYMHNICWWKNKSLCTNIGKGVYI